MNSEVRSWPTERYCADERLRLRLRSIGMSLCARESHTNEEPGIHTYTCKTLTRKKHTYARHWHASIRMQTHWQTRTNSSKYMPLCIWFLSLQAVNSSTEFQSRLSGPRKQRLSFLDQQSHSSLSTERDLSPPPVFVQVAHLKPKDVFVSTAFCSLLVCSLVSRSDLP